MTLKEQLTRSVQAALGTLVQEGIIPGDLPSVFLTPPKQAAHGDFSCTVALGLAKAAGRKPRDIALRLQAALGRADGLLRETQVAGPGYLNLYVADDVWRRLLIDVLQDGAAFLRTSGGLGQRVLLEYVSANPTGPLHVAHGRGAVAGDVMAKLLTLTGHDVEREYYVNDLGNQTDILARSIFLRYAELFGRPLVAPADFYPGEYVIELARQLKANVGSGYLDAPESTWLEPIRRLAIDAMRERIAKDLEAFGVHFDRWVSERELMARVDLADMVARLQEAGHIYEEGGKKWFRSSKFGDDKDRVVLREDGRPTYFASDIAYHNDKLQRGFTRLINIWGADHGGYVTRVKAGIAALGYAGDPLHVVLMQMVSLSRGGEAVRMGKRLGTAVWLREIVDEAGRDATRYFFLMRRNDAQMDFDVELATKKSLENPVYYAQMGHARLASIARRAAEAGVPGPTVDMGHLAALTLPEELGLIKMMARAPEVVADAAASLEPHQVVTYLQDLIAAFHSYYTQYKNSERVISDDAAKTAARLLMCQGLQVVLKVLLDVLGVDAPDRMALEEAANSN